MHQNERIAYPLDEGAAVAGLTRTRAYQLIASGDLATFKCGRRRMVTRRALDECIARLEAKSQGRTRP